MTREEKTKYVNQYNKENYVNINVRVFPSIKERYTAYCKKHKVSFAHLLVIAIDDYINKGAY